MSQIDISQWKEFKITDFYQPIVVPNKIHKIDMYDDLTIPVFSAGGFQGFVDHADFKPQTHYLLFGDQTCTFFYIDYPFSVMDNVKVLKPLADISLNQSLFIQTVAMRALGNIGYSRYWSILKKKVFQLPVDSNGDPDWQYMDTYIAKLTTLAHKNVSSLKEAKARPAKLNMDHWGEFKVSDWFDIRPSNYTKKNSKALKNAELFDGGNNPVIVNSNTNNGIGGYTSKPLTEQGNVITYSDTTDGANTIFYQAKPFVGYSHVKIMLPKLKLSQATMIYLTSIIISAIKNQKYDFSYKLTTDKMLNTIIKLPIDAKGEPDWEYMDNQVRHLATLSDLTITSLRSVI